jgi:hypothetical protein
MHSAVLVSNVPSVSAQRALSVCMQSRTAQEQLVSIRSVL